MILAIDLGNYNIKTSEGIHFISTFAEFDGIDPGERKVLTYNGKDYVMELKSSFDNEFNKTKKNYIPNLLWAINRSLPRGVDSVSIVLGIPVENLGTVNKFKEELENKRFTFRVKGNEKRSISIDKVAVVAEGVSSFYTLPETERRNDTLIIDIGGRTTNVVSFKNGRIEHKKQINKGMINYYEDVASKYNSKGECVNTEDIKNLIEKGIVDIDTVTFYKNELVKYIFNQVKTKCNRDYYKIWFTGGGSIELKETILRLEPKANFMDNALFTNVNGNKRIALTQWR
ncbi:ParM/StbA family protein [Romboutsia timonensis]|uniref:ParM/StbA family protein n=1 Tax=Romboutsia timonensis TaxID=1776391 RepID=UPI002A7FE327|nr:ParM/StbA family protein [Romboutsia timonensis]MDY3960959.1 ParM/StbA family protein [Romboutsia timonensis]